MVAINKREVAGREKQEAGRRVHMGFGSGTESVS